VLIGLSDSTTEGVWTWVDGSEATYTNWDHGQPGSEGDEDYAYFYYGEKWHDCSHYCNYGPDGYLCRKAGSPAPTTSPAPSPTPTTATPTATAAPTRECPYTTTASGRCLFVSDGYASAPKCETDVCGPRGAALVCIASAAENDEVSALLGDGEAWIGLNDGEREGEWSWTQGCGSEYTNWAEGEPNDFCSGEDCAMVYGSDGGLWNDQSCDYELRCVCEFGAAADEAFDEWVLLRDTTDYSCYWYEDEDEGDGWWLVFLLFAMVWLASLVGFVLGIVGIVVACSLREGVAGVHACCPCCPPGQLYCTCVAFGSGQVRGARAHPGTRRRARRHARAIIAR
jgi:hypothetical protein